VISSREAGFGGATEIWFYSDEIYETVFEEMFSKALTNGIFLVLNAKKQEQTIKLTLLRNGKKIFCVIYGYGMFTEPLLEDFFKLIQSGKAQTQSP
jgi:hypothetical protein